MPLLRVFCGKLQRARERVSSYVNTGRQEKPFIYGENERNDGKKVESEGGDNYITLMSARAHAV